MWCKRDFLGGGITRKPEKQKSAQTNSCPEKITNKMTVQRKEKTTGNFDTRETWERKKKKVTKK